MLGSERTPKALLRVPENGPTLIERVVQALAGVDARPMIVGRRGWRLPAALAHLPEVGDAGDGPLGGLIAALEVAVAPYLLVTACDMPFIEPIVVEVVVAEALKTRLGACPVVIDADGGVNVQPLLAVYRRDHLDVLRELHDEGVRSLRDVVERLEIPTVPLERDAAAKRCFTNINTPANLAEARRFAFEWTGNDAG